MTSEYFTIFVLSVGEHIEGALYLTCLAIVASRTKLPAFWTANPER